MSRVDVRNVGEKDVFKTGVDFLLNDKEANAFANTYYGSVSRPNPDLGLSVRIANWVCHGQLTSMSRSLLVFSRYKKSTHLSEEIANYYSAWITSPQSPWRDAIKLGMSMKDEVHFGQKFWAEKGFIIDQPDNIPGNLMVSFLMATRVPNQWYKICRFWYDMVHDHGADPSMAFLLLSTFTPFSDNRNVLGHSPCDRGDWSVGCSYLDDESVRMFFNGTPNKNHLNATFAQQSVYYVSSLGVSAIWWKYDNSRSNGIIRWKDDLKQRYSSTIGKLSCDRDNFGKNSTWTVSSKELAEIANEEQKRLGLTR